MEADLRGMVIYRASRVEALLDPLMALMQASPPPHALAPHELIAAHPGMQRWLGRELAVRHGPAGIAANLRIELPSAWLDRLAHELLGQEAVALRPYRREMLRWRIHEQVDAIDDAQVRAYLAGDAVTRARRRFQLADRLARIYSQYLVYRPDWLQAWAEGRDTEPAGGFLAPLWKTLRATIGKPHRGELIWRLVDALANRGGAVGAEPLHVFGVAHLAPAELAVLRAVAAHRAVVLYVPDPCREYWGGLRSELSLLREQVRLDPAGAATEGLFLEQGHPLLGAWGRMGQHFVLALADAEAKVDTTHWEDHADDDPPTRLAGVQESIRRFRPELIGEHAADARADASLRVHACHTRLRELEVLRDALLQARSERPDLKPSDIVVMMPDIHAYLPLLPAVFGAPGRHEGPLPYHCADVAIARTHPLFEAFRRLLDLPQSRLTAPEVADLLAIAPIADRLGLGADDVEVLKRWLEASRVAWALDGTFRTRFDVPGIAEHTFAWAMDRLLAGYVFGAGDGDPLAVTLADGSAIAPLDGVHGPQAALLGALDRLLLELREACADGGTRRHASAWAERLEQRIDALFLVDPTDRDAREALAALRQFVRALASEPGESGLDPELDFSVVRELLLARLDGVPERQRFLLGGVTFCGMVPQRAIPFQLVAVLGLNDGEFPRAGRDGGLDLMSRHRRLGDRDVRNDDRYLFLETVMAARWRLHLSYIGQGVRDGKPRNPAAPLAELMAALDGGVGRRNDSASENEIRESVPDSSSRRRPGSSFASETDAKSWIPASAGMTKPLEASESEEAKWQRLRPWWVRHPLQPFDARYFDGADPALYSFRQEFAQMREDPMNAPSRPFVDPASGAGPSLPAAAEAPIALAEVLGYFRDPARQLLEGRLNLRLDALDEDRLREREPLEARFEALDRVAARLFLQAVAGHPHGLPDAPPDWLRLTGLLPPGRTGEAAWQEEVGKVRALLEAIASPGHAAHALFAQPLPESRPVLVERVIGALRVHGELRDVYDTDAARWVLAVQPGKTEPKLGFKERIGFFLRWALVRLDTGPSRPVRAALVVAPSRDKPDLWGPGLNAWDDARLAALGAGDRAAHARMLADLERRVGGLLDFFRASQQRPQWFFPATSWAAVGDDPEPAVKKWTGDGHSARGERDYGAGYARLLAGERDFSEAADYADLHAAAEHLRALIRLDDAPTEGTV